jgi:uncharacterized RDD family membrane protein YckC
MDPMTDPQRGKAPGRDEGREVELPAREEAAPASLREGSESVSPGEGNPDWSLGAAGPEEAPPSVERPALPGERLRAGALDALVLLVLWGCTVYFSARVARVSLLGLVPSWPYLVAYLTFLGIVYAAYFTGMTGQTLGKMALHLYVVDPSGRPPGHLRAFARALIGAAGVILAGASVIPMFFDPARRGLHDRLLRTRVIRA